MDNIDKTSNAAAKNKQSQGKEAEQIAESWLIKQGLQLIQRNYRCRLGEIDLIMRNKTHLIFIEVRFRKNQRFGGAALSVDWQKQRKIMRTARAFLAYHPFYANYPCRFDIIAFEGNLLPIWYPNAFEN